MKCALRVKILFIVFILYISNPVRLAFTDFTAMIHFRNKSLFIYDVEN